MWRVPSEDDIVATISRDEIEAFRSGEYETDPVQTLLHRAASYVRGYLSSNGNIRLSPNEHEIPEATISPAMDYLAVDILKRLSLPVSDDRRNARREAVSYFDKIATGNLCVENYGSSESESTGGPCVQVVTAARQRVSSSKLEGL